MAKRTPRVRADWESNDPEVLGYFACPRRMRDVRRRRVYGTSILAHRVELTGNTRPYVRTPNTPPQITSVAREYRCQCGYSGWSAHVALAQQLREVSGV